MIYKAIVQNKKKMIFPKIKIKFIDKNKIIMMMMPKMMKMN